MEEIDFTAHMKRAAENLKAHTVGNLPSGSTITPEDKGFIEQVLIRELGDIILQLNHAMETLTKIASK